MEQKFTITRRTVTIASVSAILITTLILAAVSFTIRRLPDDESVAEEISGSSAYVSEKPIIEISESISESSVASDAFADVETSLIVNAGTLSDESEDIFVHGWIINEYGYTYVYDGCGYEQFNYKSAAMQRYVNSIDTFSGALSDEIRLFNIIVPVSSTFADIPREIYIEDSFYNQSQSSFVATVSSKNDERIFDIDIISKLEEQYDNGEKVFFRTDKNWTSLGAYTAYREYCKSAEVDSYSLDSFQMVEVGDYLGSFYNATREESMEAAPDSFVCYATLPSVKTSLTLFESGRIYSDYKLCNNKVGINNAYEIYFGRSASRYEVSTNVDGDALLIVGDSSSYALVPFLASHYGIIDVIDPRTTDETLEQIVSKREYSDCIMMCYSTNAVNGDYIPSLNKFIGVNRNE